MVLIWRNLKTNTPITESKDWKGNHGAGIPDSGKDRSMNETFMTSVGVIVREYSRNSRTLLKSQGLMLVYSIRKGVDGSKITQYLHKQFARYGSLQAIDQRTQQLIPNPTFARPRGALDSQRSQSTHPPLSMRSCPAEIDLIFTSYLTALGIILAVITTQRGGRFHIGEFLLVPRTSLSQHHL